MNLPVICTVCMRHTSALLVNHTTTAAAAVPAWSQKRKMYLGFATRDEAAAAAAVVILQSLTTLTHTPFSWRGETGSGRGLKRDEQYFCHPALSHRFISFWWIIYNFCILKSCILYKSGSVSLITVARCFFQFFCILICAFPVHIPRHSVHFFPPFLKGSVA